MSPGVAGAARNNRAPGLDQWRIRPDLRVAIVPMVTVRGSSYRSLKARSRKKDPTERHGARGRVKCKRRLCGRGIGPALLGSHR